MPMSVLGIFGIRSGSKMRGGWGGIKGEVGICLSLQMEGRMLTNWENGSEGRVD